MIGKGCLGVWRGGVVRMRVLRFKGGRNEWWGVFGGVESACMHREVCCLFVCVVLIKCPIFAFCVSGRRRKRRR